MSFRIQIDDWANKYRPFVCSNAVYFTRCLCFLFNLTFLMAICCYGIWDFDYYLRVSLSFLPFEWCFFAVNDDFCHELRGWKPLERAVQVNSRILWNIMERSEFIFDVLIGVVSINLNSNSIINQKPKTVIRQKIEKVKCAWFDKNPLKLCLFIIKNDFLENGLTCLHGENGETERERGREINVGIPKFNE